MGNITNTKFVAPTLYKKKTIKTIFDDNKRFCKAYRNVWIKFIIIAILQIIEGTNPENVYCYVTLKLDGIWHKE